MEEISKIIPQSRCLGDPTLVKCKVKADSYKSCSSLNGREYNFVRISWTGAYRTRHHISQAYYERLHLELEYSRVAVPFNSTYSPKPTLMTSCPIISIVSELRHAHCCMSSYQSNSRSCVGTTRVGVKVQMTQFIGSLLFTFVTIVRTLVPDEVALYFLESRLLFLPLVRLNRLKYLTTDIQDWLDSICYQCDVCHHMGQQFLVVTPSALLPFDDKWYSS